MEDIIVFPNPTSDKLTLRYELSEGQEVNVQLKDLSGKVIYRETTTATQGVNQMELNMSKFNSGMYFLQLETDNKLHIEKVMKF